MSPAASISIRIGSVDILRGMVMIVMALDHTRDFFHSTAMIADPLDPASSSPALYFTRWITHFCAPTFVFLSGLSARLSSQNKTIAEISLFLVKRGIWLVIVELTIVTFGITFNPSFNLFILQVIWAIGWSMIILGLLIRLSFHWVLVVGIILFAAHNILDYFPVATNGPQGKWWAILLTARGAFIPLDKTHFLGVFYAVLPWTAIMLLGYAAGNWFQKDFPAKRRKRLLLVTGISLIALFIVLRFAKGYGDPGAWDGKTIFSFLNTSKYPPSLQFASMTLGPALVALSLMEGLRSKWTGWVSVYGRVPFFYYILHFYLIHTLLVVVFFASGYNSSQIADPNLPFFFRPLRFGYSLWIVYAIWTGIVVLLYFPCRWFNSYKMQHRKWWLRYV